MLMMGRMIDQMKSAKPLSVFLKKWAATRKPATVRPAARPSAFQWNGVEKSAARQPSMIGDIGLRYSSQRRFGGMTVDGTTTEEANSHNWMRNGRAKRTSRYLTFSADIHMPVLMAQSVVNP